MPELQESRRPLHHVLLVKQVSKASLDSEYGELDLPFHRRISKEFIAVFNLPHLLNSKHMLRTYYIPGAVISAGDTDVTRQSS